MQLSAWKDCPRNDILCVERDVKHLLTHAQCMPTYTCVIIADGWMNVAVVV